MARLLRAGRRLGLLGGDRAESAGRSSAGSTCGRCERTRPDEPELGYRLPAAWGKGYASEGSRALVEKGFAELGVQRVFATTMAVNIGSRRVMEKAGLKFVRTSFRTGRTGSRATKKATSSTRSLDPSGNTALGAGTLSRPPLRKQRRSSRTAPPCSGTATSSI